MILRGCFAPPFLCSLTLRKFLLQTNLECSLYTFKSPFQTMECTFQTMERAFPTMECAFPTLEPSFFIREAKLSIIEKGVCRQLK